MRHLIYSYIGAYKSIINAINYFGYNDLQLNEYYRNVDPASENFSKLFKVEIPDIFDNSVDGWEENDFIKHTMPNDKFDGTNLFNLTYFITDKEGNNVLNYSVDEIIIKLQTLKEKRTLTSNPAVELHTRWVISSQWAINLALLLDLPWISTTPQEVTSLTTTLGIPIT